MHKSASIVILAAFLVLVGAGSARAIPEMVKKEALHKDSDYRYFVVKGKQATALLDEFLAHAGKYRILVWQALPEDTRAADASRVMAWVRGGGVLWFQDCRLAPYFGMQPDPLLFKEIRNKKASKGDYGGHRKFHGVAALSYAPMGSPHPVLFGVDAVQCFLMEVGDGLYSAVHQTPGLIPLLKMDLVRAGPLYDKVVAGMLKVDRGIVLFKPLVYSEQYTGDRFQTNLLEWSAGFGVPDLSRDEPGGRKSGTGAQRTAETAHDDVVLMKNRQTMAGTILNKSFKITVFGRDMQDGVVELRACAQIVMQADGWRDGVTLVDGKKLMGSVNFPEDIQLRDDHGSVHRLSKFDVASITLAPRPPKK